MRLLSIEYVPGKEIEALGMVKGTVVQTKALNCLGLFFYLDLRKKAAATTPGPT